jgi:hypothetical protein
LCLVVAFDEEDQQAAEKGTFTMLKNMVMKKGKLELALRTTVGMSLDVIDD